MIRNVVQKAEQEFPLVGGGGIPDAPSDGDLYGRKNGAWVEAASTTDIPLVPSFFYDGTDTTFLLGEIPSSYAAYGSLTQVYLGNSVTTIGDSAFASNSSLTSVTIGNSVTSIGSYAFFSSSLTSVTIPNSVTSIGDGAFSSDSYLATVNCLVTKTIIDAETNIFVSTASPLTINARASDGTWTAGTGLSIGGNANVTVVKNL